MATVTPQELFYTPYEPKLKNRFIMELGDTGIPAFTIKTMQRPQITFDEVVLEHMNLTRYVKGKGRWQTLQITLYDPIVISDAAFGDLDFADSNPVEITLTLRYDYAELEF